ncbi:MAG: hypothetical protein AAF542_20035 [Pseudomonadota bacterium]
MKNLKNLILIVCLFPGCLASAQVFEQVRHTSDRFDPEQNELFEILFSLNLPARVVLKWYDDREMLVSRVSVPGMLPAGEHKMFWDGKDLTGNALPNEAYHYVLVAETANGEEQVFDLTDTVEDEFIEVKSIDYDPDEKIISYRIDRKARVNIRIGLRDNGPLLRTLVNWVPRTDGENQENWDGKDQDGLLDLLEHPNLSFWIQAYPLSKNTILVGVDTNKSEYASSDLVQGKRSVGRIRKKKMYAHMQQPAESRNDFDLKLEVVGVEPESASGVYNVQAGRVPIRLEAKKKDRARAYRRRLEPVFYVDGVFAFETEVGYLPMVWSWNTKNAPAGLHYVTVNVRGYEGNFGVATIRVKIMQKQSEDAHAPMRGK